MQMADELVQIIANAHELDVEKFRRIMIFTRFQCRPAGFIKHQSTSEMDGAHADGFGAQPDALKFACCEAEIELLVAGF
jgi:hypothetical protein